jgi:hypothetical protein
MKTRALTTTNTPAAAIRVRLAQLGPRGVGKRFPEAIRREVLTYLTAQRERGIGLPPTARELGLREKTIENWLAQARAMAVPAQFHGVELVDRAPEPAPRRLVLHAPRGLRVEGLDVVSLAELLRRLA